MIELELPFPPSVNHYWRVVRGRPIISAEGREYRKRVVLKMKARRIRPLKGALRLWANFIPPDKRRRDLDNCLKALLDALEKGGAYENDSQVKEMALFMADKPMLGSRVMLRIEEIGKCNAGRN